MNQQEQINRVVELLDKLRAADPKAQKAFELITEPCFFGHNHAVPGICHTWGRLVWKIDKGNFQAPWPDGAVRGLLEGVVETVWAKGYLPGVLDLEDAWTGVSQTGLDWYRWRKNAAPLAAALIAALEEEG